MEVCLFPHFAPQTMPIITVQELLSISNGAACHFSTSTVKGCRAGGADLILIRLTLALAGDYDNAIDYLVTMGGIAREDDYEYLGQDNFCKKEYMAYSDRHKSKLIEVKVSGSLAGVIVQSAGCAFSSVAVMHRCQCV